MLCVSFLIDVCWLFVVVRRLLVWFLCGWSLVRRSWPFVVGYCIHVYCSCALFGCCCCCVVVLFVVCRFQVYVICYSLFVLYVTFLELLFVVC